MQNRNSTQCKNVFKNSASNSVSKCALNGVKNFSKNISKTAAFLLFLGSFNSVIAANDLDKDWNIINYNPSTIQYTGKNVILGIIDSGFPHVEDNISLQERMIDFSGSNNYTGLIQSKGETMMHGSQVAAIILGNKINSERPYGMAYESKFYGVTYLNPDIVYDASIDNIYDYYKDKKVKIINNSWGDYFYPNIDMQIVSGKTLFTSAFQPIKNNNQFSFNDGNGTKISSSVLDYAKTDPALDSLMKLSKEGVLMVRSSGNDGMAAPSLADSLPTYDEDLRAWIVVGAIDSAYAKKNSNGGFDLQKQTMYKPNNGVDIKPEFLHGRYIQGGGITTFSNGFKGTESYSILAPGSYISLLNPYYNDSNIFYDGKKFQPERNYMNDEFFKDDGTSFSAPMVSAAAALVAEKYPFLSGAQLADVLLSTANNNITLPKIIVKVSGKAYNDGKENYYYYDVIYVEQNQVPDKTQVRQDLMKEIGFSDTQADHILNHLFDGGVKTMTKEELIGQGILDVEKALGGLARIDANRMLDSDVDTKDGTKAHYTINLGNSSAEFSNDISERLWEQKYHKDEAINKQDKLKTVKNLGLKIQNGTLTLSGKNSTYTGDTIIESGALNLKGGELKNSRVVVQNGSRFVLENGSAFAAQNLGTMSGIGKITGDLENSGILRAGFYNENNGIVSDTINGSEKIEVGGTFTQNPSGTLQMAFTKNGGGAINTQLQAAQYEIKGGKLEYLPTQTANTLIVPNDTIMPNIGTLSDKLTSFNDVSAKETNTLEFEVSSDRKSFTAKQKQGAFTPGGSQGGGSSTGGGNSSGGGSSGSGGSAGGGTIPSTPSAPNLNAQNSDNLANALSNMFSRRISDDYNAAFAALDTMPRGSYEKAIESLHEIPHNSGIVGVDSIQKTMSVKSTLFMLNPSNLAFAPTAALGGDYIEPSYTSYTKTQVSAGLTYRRTNATDFKQDSYLLDLQAKKPIGGDSVLNGFVGAAYEKSTKDSSEIKSNIFSIGVGGARDLKSYGILGSVSAGFSNNKLNQNIANLGNTSTSADYNSYFFHAQGGVYVPFWLGEFGERTNTKLSPIAMLDFTSIYQNSFTQSGGLFAKKFDKSNFNNFRSWLGLNLSHIRDLESGAKFAGNIFGFYWHNFNKPKDQNMSFVDASDLHFSSSTDIGRDGLYLGAAGKWAWDRYFVHTSIGGELASKYNQIELMLRFGFEL